MKKTLLILIGLVPVLVLGQAANRAAQKTQIDTMLPSNNAGAITASTLRTVLKALVDSAYNPLDDGTPLLPAGIGSTLQAHSAALDTVAGNGSSYYLSRGNHTGTQAQSTVTDLVADLAAKETPAGAQAKADAKVTDAINDGTTAVAPSQNAVFDALSLKQAADADLTTWAGVTPSANGQSLVAAANYAAMRSLLDLEAGTDFLALPTGTPNGSKFLRDDNTWQPITGGTWGSITGTLSAQTDLQTALDAKRDLSLTTNAQIGTSYTLVLADAGKLVSIDNASANTVTIPLNATVAYPVGTLISVQRLGAGATTITRTGGVTFSPTNADLVIGAAGNKAYLRKTATNTWEVLLDNLDNLTASADPTTGDDAADGYNPGSLWYVTSGGTVGSLWTCASNAVGAAVWVRSDYRISNTAYDATSWNGNADAPSKDAVRDKFESLSSGWTSGLLFTSTASSKQIDNSTTETTIFSGTIPGGTLGTTGCVEVNLNGTVKNNTGGSLAFILRVKYGATTIYADTSQAVGTSIYERNWEMNLRLFADNSATAQRMAGVLNLGPGGATTTGYGDLSTSSMLAASNFGGTSTETSSGDLTFSVTIELASANTEFEWTTHKASAWRK